MMLPIDDQKFYEICKRNSRSRIERTAKGEVIVMPPTGGETGIKNSELIYQLVQWNKKYKIGYVFDSSTGFKLPSGAIRSPDLGFVYKEKWNKLSKEEKKKFPPICPDFVVEILSESDSLNESKRKMEEWIRNGCLLAWLLDSENETVYVYQKNKPLKRIRSFQKTLSSKEILPEFSLDLNELKIEL